MADNVLQNAQRGLIFNCFVNLLVFSVVIGIKFYRKQIGVRRGQQAKQSGGSDEKMDAPVEALSVLSTVIQPVVLPFDHYACQPQDYKGKSFFETILMQTGELQTDFMPLMIIYPLNLETGTSKAYTLAGFLVVSLAIPLFNFLKLHRRLIKNKYLRVLFEQIWYIMNFTFLVNIWLTTPALQMYEVV